MNLRRISKAIMITVLSICVMAVSIPVFASATPAAAFKLFVDGVQVKTDVNMKVSCNQLIISLKNAARLIDAVSGSVSKVGTD
jgi:hypothetical protein